MAVTTLVHLGDFHAAPGPRNPDRYRALDQVLDEAGRIPTLGAWLWPGDLSHQRQSIEDKNAIASRLRWMAMRAPVVLTYGNHDLPGDLDVFAHLHARHPIAVVARPECVRLHLATGEAATIFCLPYPSKAGLVATGVVPADIGGVSLEALDLIFMKAAGELEEARAAGDVVCMVGHINVGGAIMCAGQPNIGREIELSPLQLDRLGPIYKGLNHIHKHQEIAGAHYAGSMCRLDWGEIDPKFYNVVTIYEGGASIVVEPNPIHVAPMYHVEGVLTREGFVIDEADALPPTWVGTEVRVRYRYRQSEIAVLDESLVRAPFLEALRLKVEPIAVPDRAVRAPAVAAALTLAEKVAAWADVAGTTPAPSLVEKLARLEQTEPATLLTQIQTELAALDERAEEVAV